MKQKSSKTLFILTTILVGVVAVLVVVTVVTKFEGEMPRLQLEGSVEAIGASHSLKGLASDQKSGLRRIWIALIQNGKEKVLFDQSFPSKGFLQGGLVQSVPFSVEIDADKLGLVEGEALLRTGVWDFSYRGWLSGNQTYEERKVLIDTRPPVIEVLSRAHNLNQGGSGLVVYRVSEPSPVSGIHVGESFFPGRAGFSEDDNLYLAFFPFAYSEDPGAEIWLTTEDRAGNRGQAGLEYHVNAKRFKNDQIALSDSFLKRKLPEFSRFLDAWPSAAPIDQFLKVNHELRRENHETLKEACRQSDDSIHWEGPFGRLPGSARRAGFADHRKYEYEGKVVDEQVHLGIDLASNARSPVPAANAGRVALAEYVGIYGNTVIVDHGFGLFSLYGHLSRMDVQKDQMVSKGETIGYTGTTGLAGGDHLHYGMVIGQVFVNPIEWWDPNWIKNNMSGKLREAAREG